MMKDNIVVVILFLMSSCISKKNFNNNASMNDDFTKNKISKINLIDFNNYSETITNSDRLKQFDNTNFLLPQAYKKVLRVFKKNNDDNKTFSCITTYHDNCGIKQYLEIVNGRANGIYKEYHDNGNVKLSVKILGGDADISDEAKMSWIFHGVSSTYDRDGDLVAKISYDNGFLNGPSVYYYKNGNIKIVSLYKNNLLDGESTTFYENGAKNSVKNYLCGKIHGTQLKFSKNGTLLSSEIFENGKLDNGEYFSCDSGELIAKIENGNGWQVVNNDDGFQGWYSYEEGVQKGEARILSLEGRLLRRFFVCDGFLNGIDTEYYDDDREQRKSSISWEKSVIVGTVSTWYHDGQQESQKTIIANKKNGMSYAWYKNGNIMMIEEYENDKLIKGEYFKIGELEPISKVTKGNGIACIFDKNGFLINKILYEDGSPTVT